jgi:MFS family permease
VGCRDALGDNEGFMSNAAPLTGAPPPGATRAEGRRRTLAVVFAGFCAFLTLYAPQPLLPMMAQAFQVSAKAATRVMAASTLAVVLAAPLVSMLADRFGRKRVIVPSALLLSIATLLAATAGGLGQLLLWRFWQGIFTPGIFAVTVAYINEEWAEGAGSAISACGGGFRRTGAWRSHALLGRWPRPCCAIFGIRAWWPPMPWASACSSPSWGLSPM